mgnify:CR=1 FL=1
MNHITGSQDGRIHVWASDSGHKVAVLEGSHPGPTKCVRFSPKYMMIASACTNMVSLEVAYFYSSLRKYNLCQTSTDFQVMFYCPLFTLAYPFLYKSILIVAVPC